MAINYLSQVNGFHRIAREKNLTDTTRAIYFTMLDENNAVGWDRSTFRVSDAMLAIHSGSTKRKVESAKNRLKQVGLIDFKDVGKGRGATTIYAISQLDSKGNVKVHGSTTDRLPINDVSATDKRHIDDILTTDRRQKEVSNVPLNGDKPRQINNSISPKVNESKLNERKVNDADRNAGFDNLTFKDEEMAKVIEHFNRNARALGTHEYERLAMMKDEYGVEKVIVAIDKAVETCRKRGDTIQSLNYLESILKRMSREGEMKDVDDKSRGDQWSIEDDEFFNRPQRAKRRSANGSGETDEGTGSDGDTNSLESVHETSGTWRNRKSDEIC